MVKRLLEMTPRELVALDGPDLAASIRLSEGRTLAVEIMCTVEPPVEGVSGGELAAAMGADIIVLDGYDPFDPRIAGVDSARLAGEIEPAMVYYSHLVGRPVGINLIVADEAKAPSLGGRLFSLQAVQQSGVPLIFLYVRPHQGGTPEMQVAAARQIARSGSRPPLVVGVPSFGKPSPRDAQSEESLRAEALALLDAGCAGVAFPMPGSKQGWMADAVAVQVDAVHAAGGLAWLFITGSVEGAPQSVLQQLAVQGKQLGADAFRLDEAGLSGMPPPENILAFSMALRGARHTYRRMASSRYR